MHFLPFLSVLLLLAIPYLSVRRFSVTGRLANSIAAAGAVILGTNAVILILLHLLHVEITQVSLLIFYATIFVCLLVLTLLRRVQILPKRDPAGMFLFLILLSFAVLVFPYTNLAGIDTYKWQDVATSIRTEQNIPWLIHPLSLLGFTPRSYPCLQPFMLATLQIMGGFGVNAGFFLVSLLSGAIGLFAAYLLGLLFFTNRRSAILFAMLYVFSPVFMRYNHWATGRGFLLALYPLFLAALTAPHGRRKILFLIPAGAMLVLSHKTGFVIVGMGLLSLCVSPLIPRNRKIGALLGVLAALAVTALSVMLAPHTPASGAIGQATGFAHSAVARFGWYFPFALVGLVWAFPRILQKQRRLAALLVLSIPLAFTRDMYGALVALPSVALFTVAAIHWLTTRFPRSKAIVLRTVCALAVLSATGIVVFRSLQATPRDIRAAADFLERYDPKGPFIVHAPDRLASKIQAYASGCPRYTIRATHPSLLWSPLPSLRGSSPRKILRAITDYLRQPFTFRGIDIKWYGDSPRDYYVVYQGKGTRPDQAERIFSKGNVEMYKPAGQQQPASTGRL